MQRQNNKKVKLYRNSCIWGYVVYKIEEIKLLHKNEREFEPEIIVKESKEKKESKYNGETKREL